VCRKVNAQKNLICFFLGCWASGKVNAQKSKIFLWLLLASSGVWEGSEEVDFDVVVVVVVVNVAQKLACSSCETFFICRC